MGEAAAPRCPPRPWAVGAVVAAILVFLFTVGGLAAARWRLYVSTWDLAIFDQATWLLANGREPFLTTRGLTLFEHHLSLALLPLALVYRVVPGPLTLVWAQALAIGLAAVPVFLLAREATRSDAAGVAWTVLFLSYPPLQYMALHDFHCEPFALPCLITALYCAHRRWWRAYGVAIVLALLAKEDAGLAVGCLGLGLLLAGERRVGAITAVAGVAYTVIALKLVMPAFSPRGAGAFYVADFFSHLGNSPLQVALSPIFRPRAVLASLFRAANGYYLLHLFVPLAGLCLLKPSWGAGAAANLFLNMVSMLWATQVIDYHYTGFITPFVVPAAVVGGAWLSDRIERRGVRRATALATPLALAAVGTWLLPSAWPAVFRGPATSPRQTPAVIALWESQHDWAPACDELVDRIPPDASVSASMDLLDKVSARERAYRFPAPFYDDPTTPLPTDWTTAMLEGLRTHLIEYLLLRTDPGNPTPLPADAWPVALGLVEDSECYEVVADIGAVRLYRRIEGIRGDPPGDDRD